MDANLLQLVGQFGFPVVVSLILLFRYEQAIREAAERHQAALRELSHQVRINNWLLARQQGVDLRDVERIVVNGGSG